MGIPLQGLFFLKSRKKNSIENKGKTYKHTHIKITHQLIVRLTLCSIYQNFKALYNKQFSSLTYVCKMIEMNEMIREC